MVSSVARLRMAPAACSCTPLSAERRSATSGSSPPSSTMRLLFAGFTARLRSAPGTTIPPLSTAHPVPAYPRSVQHPPYHARGSLPELSTAGCVAPLFVGLLPASACLAGAFRQLFDTDAAGSARF
eukprot:2284234-Rhodomonas_salina.2